MIDINELRQSLGAIQPEEVAELLDRLEAAEKEATHQKALAESALRVAEGWERKCGELRAKVTEMEKQEPVAKVRVHRTGGNAGLAWSVAPLNDFDSLPLMRDGDRLYTLPGAQALPAENAVAYLDLGTGGYMDVGTDLTDEELAALPKGRHMLGIIGTYGVDGYVPAQPAPSLASGDVSLISEGKTRPAPSVPMISAPGSRSATARPRSFCTRGGRDGNHPRHRRAAMAPAEVITFLRALNEWGRSDEDIPQPDPREIGEAIDAAIEMIESAEEDRALCDKLAGILTRTANVLKGEPKPLHRHGWHDLPEVARKLVSAAGQNTVNAMLAHSRKSGKQRARKPLAKHAKETSK